MRQRIQVAMNNGRVIVAETRTSERYGLFKVQTKCIKITSCSPEQGEKTVRHIRAISERTFGEHLAELKELAKENGSYERLFGEKREQPIIHRVSAPTVKSISLFIND